MAFSILVIDDEPTLREVLSLRLADWGFDVRTAEDAGAGAKEVEARVPDLVLCDFVLPDASGLDVLRKIKAHNPALPVVMMTAHGNVNVAVDAMKSGAMDFLTKPLDYVMLRALVEVTASEADRRAKKGAPHDVPSGAGPIAGLVGQSRAMRDVQHTIETVASSDASAIITGESGTGKELVARAIHDLSKRSGKPFIAVNAAAIPEGLVESEIFGHEQGAFTGALKARAGVFELANGGTLFLDEIAEMPIGLQPKLLRILSTRQTRRLGGSREISFDVRVLAATNRSPTQAIKDGLLREDLFYRLAVFEIGLPPLRDRGSDIPLLAKTFVRELSGRHNATVTDVSEPAMALLQAHAWPGNVRELRNVIERAVIVAARHEARGPRHEVTEKDLPNYLQTLTPGKPATITLPAGATLAEAERILILQTLDRVGNSKAEAARQLGLDVKTIRNKLRSYGLQGGE